MSIKGQPEPEQNHGLGKPVEEKAAPQGERWLPVPGKPHLRRSSITGRVRTYIPANERANFPFVWPNYRPARPLEPVDEDNQ